MATSTRVRVLVYYEVLQYRYFLFTNTATRTTLYFLFTNKATGTTLYKYGYFTILTILSTFAKIPTLTQMQVLIPPSIICTITSKATCTRHIQRTTNGTTDYSTGSNHA
jgi:hypothetical protein